MKGGRKRILIWFSNAALTGFCRQPIQNLFGLDSTHWASRAKWSRSAIGRAPSNRSLRESKSSSKSNIDSVLLIATLGCRKNLKMGDLLSSASLCIESNFWLRRWVKFCKLHLKFKYGVRFAIYRRTFFKLLKLPKHSRFMSSF